MVEGNPLRNVDTQRRHLCSFTTNERSDTEILNWILRDGVEIGWDSDNVCPIYAHSREEVIHAMNLESERSHNG